MCDSPSVPDLVRRMRDGDSTAAEQLFVRYTLQLNRLAERRLSRRLAGRVEGEDVVQSVFRTFFRRCRHGEFRIDSSSHLWRLLVQVTVRKVAAKARRLRGETFRASAAGGDGATPLAEAVCREPGPQEAAELVDQVTALLRGLPETHGRILQMRLEGYAVAEIAPRLDVSRQTVYRVLALLQRRLSRDAGLAVEKKL
jgi:RNA polymerase sigma-70 factor (ECF subfamily)